MGHEHDAMKAGEGSGIAASVDGFRTTRASLQDYDTAYCEFRWPVLTAFNWALDWFDGFAIDPATTSSAALRIAQAVGAETRLSFAELSARSNQVANWLRDPGVNRADPLILMLDNQVDFTELPKTISGKIRGVELREREQQRTGGAPAAEYRDEDVDDLGGR